MDYTLIFDGGSRGNPGPAFGSYAIIRNADGWRRIVRLDFEGELTNNEAEYETLIAGLQALIDHIEQAGGDPQRFSVEVRGDSRLVIHQVAGRWKVRKHHLRPLWDRARELLQRFGAYELTWQPRETTQAVLGH